MITVTKTPLRISIAGGSTDLQGYLDVYKRGKVVSFTPELFTYIILKRSSTKYYRVIYSRIENVLTSQEIQNDIARVVLSYFEMPPVEVMFTADIPSTGSGLASSSSYLISLIKACLEFKNLKWTQEEIGKVAIKLEREFNPLTGYQDVYGCLIEGLKVMNFDENGLVDYKVFSSQIFYAYDFFLVPTEGTRSSTDILATVDYKKVRKLLDVADIVDEALQKENFEAVIMKIREGWINKQKTSPHIMNPKIKQIDKALSKCKGVLAWRLIGAGNGGYFLVVAEKETRLHIEGLKIN
jgi:D-glycero-alpha-D-manno-heptose-7-phosphate kinase